MKFNIALTAYFNQEKYSNYLREEYLITHFKDIQFFNKELQFFALNWWSINTNGFAEVFDLNKGRFISQFDVRNLSLIHVFKLGYHPDKKVLLNTKWKDFESKLKLLEQYNIPHINPIETLKYQLNKEYLIDLNKKGLP